MSLVGSTGSSRCIADTTPRWQLTPPQFSHLVLHHSLDVQAMDMIPAVAALAFATFPVLCSWRVRYQTWVIELATAR